MKPFKRAPKTSLGAEALAALRRQQCNPMQPGATQCNRVQPKHARGKTNPPIPPPDATQPPAASQPNQLNPITQFVLQSVIDRTCNAMQPGATGCNPTQPIQTNGKTNPPPEISNSRHDGPMTAPSSLLPSPTRRPPSPAPSPAPSPRPPPATQPPATPPPSLTPRQLAAARLIAAGIALPDVAAQLALNRSTVWRWTRTLAFRAELDRLHRQWSAPPPPRQLRMSHS